MNANPNAPRLQNSHKQAPLPISSLELREAIRRRAEAIYVASGRIPGHDAGNWAQAEAEIRCEYAAYAARNAAIVVSVDGVRYVGEYSSASAHGYLPGEFAAGTPVPVRFEGEKMYVKRPNGMELETQIVERRIIDRRIFEKIKPGVHATAHATQNQA